MLGLDFMKLLRLAVLGVMGVEGALVDGLGGGLGCEGGGGGGQMVPFTTWAFTM